MAKKILIIEDDKFIRDMIGQQLLSEGYDIAEAENVEKGVELVEKEKPDLVLLDLILPGEDGFKVLAEMKSKPETKNIPVIILSNLSQKEDVERGIRMGADDYLVKAHFTPSDIVDKIREVLR